MNLNFVAALISAYLLGSIPFGYLVAKLKGINIQEQGSGNIGATNVFRTLGVGPGITVFLLDLLKGTLSIYLATSLTSEPWQIIFAGVFAIIGHSYPIFLKFKGGRGSATGLGILLGIAPDIFLAALILTIIIVFLTRYVSLASITVPTLVCFAFFFLGRPLAYGLASGLVAILIIVRHIPNIKRLLAGTENKIGGKNG